MNEDEIKKYLEEIKEDVKTYFALLCMFITLLTIILIIVIKG